MLYAKCNDCRPSTLMTGWRTNGCVKLKLFHIHFLFFNTVINCTFFTFTAKNGWTSYLINYWVHRVHLYVRAGKKWESGTNGWTTLQTSIRVSRWQSMLNHEKMINDLIILWYAHRISRFKLKLKATMLYLPCGK